MAFDYCKVRGLDIFKKPVHIVPMWNSALRRETETIWVGINEIQITAHRTGQFAGMDSAKWGPLVTKTFSGQKKNYGNMENVSVELTYPEWCEVVVYRLVGGQPRPGVVDLLEHAGDRQDEGRLEGREVGQSAGSFPGRGRLLGGRNGRKGD